MKYKIAILCLQTQELEFMHFLDGVTPQALAQRAMEQCAEVPHMLLDSEEQHALK